MDFIFGGIGRLYIWEVWADFIFGGIGRLHILEVGVDLTFVKYR